MASKSTWSMSDDEVLAELREYIEDLGYMPSVNEVSESGPFSGTLIYNRFGSWPNAVEMAGLEPNHRPMASASTNSCGHRELEVRDRGVGERYTVMMHRLHATLVVDSVQELDGKEVHHTNGCPFDNREGNYEILEALQHFERDQRKLHISDYKGLCRSCENVAYFTELSGVEYCPYCGQEYDDAELAEASPIDWQIPH